MKLKYNTWYKASEAKPLPNSNIIIAIWWNYWNYCIAEVDKDGKIYFIDGDSSSNNTEYELEDIDNWMMFKDPEVL